MRGVLHAIAAALSLVAAIALVLAAASPRGRIAAGVYGGSLVTLFSVSALYHRRSWSRRAYRVIRTLDHCAIYVLIAGTYTPMCVLLGGRAGMVLLYAVWAGALLGVAKEVFWRRAPKRLGVALYLLLGWMVVPTFPALRGALGNEALLLLGAGGLAYTVGALVYAFRRPDPFPRVFGYHEIFHALVVAAAAGHFVVAANAIARLS
jgi:hemolysin III